MTSHNIASIVNINSVKSTSSFFADFIWNDTSTVIDSTPPSHLQIAAKMRIKPNTRKRFASSNTKLTPFKSMSQLSSHRFHLAELFQNDGMLRFCDFNTSPNINHTNNHYILL